MEISGIKQWLTESSETLQTEGLSGINGVVRPPYREIIRQVSRPINSGKNIFEKEWDVLLVLDACRLDLMQEVVADRSLGWTVNELESVDTMTGYWMEKTFTPEYKNEMAETVYICGNPHSASLLSEADFRVLDEIWKHNWDEATGTVLAEDATDRAIAMRRKYPDKRLLVHYMQPHNPFISDLDLNTKPKGKDDVLEHEGLDPWHRLEQGDVGETRVWNAYRKNLEYVIDEIEELVKNIEAEKLVITSDHGNAKGEWGLYGHPHGMPFQCLRTVPWIELTTTDQGERNPEIEMNENSKIDVEERLESLGYV